MAFAPANFLRRCLRACWSTVAALIVLVAVVVTLVRVSLPNIDHFSDPIAGWLGAALHAEVQFDQLRARWIGWSPELILSNVRLLEPEEGVLLAHFDTTGVVIDPLASLFNRYPALNRLWVEGARLGITRQEDGSLSVLSLETRHQEAFAELAGWLRNQGDLELRNSSVIWEDLKLHHPPTRFEPVTLHLRNDGTRWQINATLNLPGTRPHRVELALDTSGDPFGRHWEGTFYIGGRGAWPGKLLGIPADRGIPLPQHLDYQIWSRWKDARLLEGRGRIGLQDMVVDGTFNLQQLSSELSFHRRQEGGWRLRAHHLQVRTSNGEWPLSELVTTLDWKGPEPWIILQASTLRLQDLIPLLRTGGFELAASEPVLRLDPRGELGDVTAAWFGSAQGGRYFLRAGIRQFKVERYDRWPALDGLSGELVLDPQGGTLRLDSRGLDLQGDRIDRARGLLWWEQEDQQRRFGIEGLTLRAGRADLALWGQLRQPVAAPEQGVLELVSEFRNLDAPDLLQRLPGGLLPEEGEHWLRHALRAGILSGGALFRGRLRDYPFRQNEGKFELLLGLENGVLDYARGWPAATNLDAEIRFDGTSVDIHLAEGTLFETPLSGVRAGIPEVRHPRSAWIEGRLRFPAARGKAFVEQTPLKQTLGQQLQPLEISGDLGLELRLDLLFPEHRIQPTGTLLLDGNALRDIDSGLVLGQLRGKLPFNHQGLLPTRLEGRLLGQPVAIELGQTRLGNGGELPAALLRGHLSHSSLAGWLEALSDGKARWLEEFGFLGALQGQARWQARLRREPRGKGLELDIESDLRGLALQTPPPLGKEKVEARELQITATLGLARQRRVRFRYGGQLAGTVEFVRKGEHMKLERVRVGLGDAGKAPASDATVLIHGRLRQLDLAAWTNWLRDTLPDRIDPRRIGDLPKTAIDLQVDQLQIYGQRIDQVHVVAVSTPESWKITIDGKQAKGSIEVPRGVDQGPIFADFERLELSHQPLEGNRKPMDPRRIPQMIFHCRNFVFEGKRLGELDFKSYPDDRGLYLDSFTIHSPDFNIRAEGNWTTDSDGHHSDFRIEAQAPALGQLLRRFDYNVAGLEGGEARLEINARWEGSPADFDLKRLNGTLNLRIGKGRFLEIDPRAGRIFGLLSFHTLARRLSLDFSDLFKKGFVFDSIEGSFLIENGDAYTNDLVMEAPSARITVSGRVGLASQDYDQIVTVMPHFASSLPTASALFGPVGAAVGAAVLLAEKVFKKLPENIDKLLLKQYSITGSWDKPVIRKLKDEELPPEETNGEQ